MEHPNSATSRIQIKLSGYKGKTAIQLRSMDGKLLRQIEWDVFSKTMQQQLDVSDLASGTYLLIVIDSNRNITNTKVVIAH